MLDFSPIRERKQSLAEFAADIHKQDLYTSSNALLDRIDELIADATNADVVFQPVDPEAHDAAAASPDEEGIAWTLGHVIVHATAGSEEGAALALDLARGVPLADDTRSRYETPWDSVTTIEQVRQRLAESRRMRVAMLDAWPDQPHLDNTQTPIKRLGPLNAVGRFLMGLMHEDGHLEQIAEIMRQARADRGA